MNSPPSSADSVAAAVSQRDSTAELYWAEIAVTEAEEDKDDAASYYGTETHAHGALAPYGEALRRLRRARRKLRRLRRGRAARVDWDAWCGVEPSPQHRHVPPPLAPVVRPSWMVRPRQRGAGRPARHRVAARASSGDDGSDEPPHSHRVARPRRASRYALTAAVKPSGPAVRARPLNHHKQGGVRDHYGPANCTAP